VSWSAWSDISAVRAARSAFLSASRSALAAIVPPTRSLENDAHARDQLSDGRQERDPRSRGPGGQLPVARERHNMSVEVQAVGHGVAPVALRQRGQLTSAGRQRAAVIRGWVHDNQV
jgi:hypothetical protein